jgi:hypothetical protein
VRGGRAAEGYKLYRTFPEVHSGANGTYPTYKSCRYQRTRLKQQNPLFDQQSGFTARLKTRSSSNEMSKGAD